MDPNADTYTLSEKRREGREEYRRGERIGEGMRGKEEEEEGKIRGKQNRREEEYK